MLRKSKVFMNFNSVSIMEREISRSFSFSVPLFYTFYKLSNIRYHKLH